VALAAVVTLTARGAAQQLPQRFLCDGNTVSAIDIRTLPPRAPDTSTVRGTIMNVEHERHMTTHSSVVAAYLRLHVGDQCSERNRAESERILRAQPFLASAIVQTQPDGPGQVRVIVVTIDEMPIILGAGAENGTVSQFMLGTENLAGQGTTAAVSYENGFGYRDGFGARVLQYGFLGRPYTASASADRAPLGESWAFAFENPFLSQYQYTGFHAGAGYVSDYYSVIRPVGEDLSLYVRRVSYLAGIITRLNVVGTGGAPAGLIGAAVLGEDTRTGTTPVIVADTGLVPVIGPTAFDNRYAASNVTRIALIGGLRAIRFVTVQSFDAITAAQDIGVGVQFDALAGPTVRGLGAGRDLFISNDFYWGIGSARSFLYSRIITEGRANRGIQTWDGVVADGKLAWYLAPNDQRTQLVTVEVATIQGLQFPMQLTFRDTDGGLRGYPDSPFAGGTRAVLRAEERWVIHPWGTHRADFAVAGFTDAGEIWAGDAPYGFGSGLRGSLGVSLLGAYPAGSKHTYRVDFAVPVNPASGSAKFEIRFSSADRTRTLWQEPGDIMRARDGAIPANRLSWLPR
jgi:hypothetical protein